MILTLRKSLQLVHELMLLIINLELSREYLETEKRSRPPPRVRFDEPQPYKPWRDADGGDDWSLLEPEPMRRATRAKLRASIRPC